jgi:hypothetical protein
VSRLSDYNAQKWKPRFSRGDVLKNASKNASIKGTDYSTLVVQTQDPSLVCPPDDSSLAPTDSDTRTVVEVLPKIHRRYDTVFNDSIVSLQCRAVDLTRGTSTPTDKPATIDACMAVSWRWSHHVPVEEKSTELDPRDRRMARRICREKNILDRQPVVLVGPEGLCRLPLYPHARSAATCEGLSCVSFTAAIRSCLD